MNHSYDLEIEVLNPVHIGDGTTVSGIDYFCYQEALKPPYKRTTDYQEIKNESFLYRFKINDFKSLLEKSDIIVFEKLLFSGKDTFEMRNFIYSKLETDKKTYKEKFLKITIEKIEITNKFYALWNEKIIGKTKYKGKTQEKRNNEFTNQLSQLEIKSFINSIGRYYIPGSSLKGAIRTILTNTSIEQSPVENDPFKKLIVRDSNFIKDGIEIGNLARKGGNIGDGTYIEYLKSGVITKTNIAIKDFLDEANLIKVDISKASIISQSKQYYKAKIDSYIQELQSLLKHKELLLGSTPTRMKIEKINSVITSFNEIKKRIENLKENQCILNIGFGGGYWFKSFEGNEKHPNPQGIKHLIDEYINIPRTTYSIDLENLGFILCTFKN